MMDWIREHETILATLGAASVVMFVGSLLLVPVLVCAIPVDYFARERPHPTHFSEAHPVLRMLWHVAKNLLGTVFVLAGLAMLFLPGQGLLTLLLGFMLLDFPGKYRAERWLVARPGVHRALDWIRRKAHRPPLETGAETER